MENVSYEEKMKTKENISFFLIIFCLKYNLLELNSYLPICCIFEAKWSIFSCPFLQNLVKTENIKHACNE